jgi:phosphoribosylformimino-5-aminoimidazole carboxamide ribotide isomerase
MQKRSLIVCLKLCFQVIVTSHLFPSAKFSLDRLKEISKLVGKDKLVVDVRYARYLGLRLTSGIFVINNSCRRKGDRWVVAMNKWQDLTDLDVTKGTSFAVPRLCPISCGYLH